MVTERASGARQLRGVTARIALLTVGLVMVQGLGSRFIPAPDPAAQPSLQPLPQPSAGFLAIVVAVALMQTVALAYPTLRSRWHGWRLAGTVFLLYFGTVTFMSQKAPIHAEFLGFGICADAYHLTAPEPNGEGVERVVRIALAHAGVSPSEVDTINAHGTATPFNDIAETRGIKRVFGERAKEIPISGS